MSNTSFMISTDALREKAQASIIRETAERAFGGDLRRSLHHWSSPNKASLLDYQVSLRVKEASGEAAALTAANTPQLRRLPTGAAGDASGWTYSARLGFLSPDGVCHSERHAKKCGVDTDGLKARAGSAKQ